MERSSRSSFSNDSYGQGLAEYIIIVVVVATLVIIGLRYYGGSLFGQFQNATDQVSAVGSTKEPLPLGGKGAEEGASSSEPAKPASESAQNVMPLEESAPSSSAKPSSAEEPKDLESRLARLRPGVGESDDEMVSQISIDWKTIGTILGILLVVGVAIVFKQKRTLAPKKSKKKKSKRSFFSKGAEEGQVLVIGLIVCVGLMLASITVANVGMMVAEKIQLQDTVDAAAYSSAVAEARYMNLTAYLNRTMVANYDMMAFDTAMWAVIDADDHAFAVIAEFIYQIAEVAIIIPPASRVIDTVADLVAAAHSVMHPINSAFKKAFAQDESLKLNGIIETYNTDILSTYEGLLYAAIQSSRWEIQREVAKKMDPDVVMTSTLALGAEAVSYDELARAVDWVIRDPNSRTGIFKSFNDSFNRMMGKPANESDNPLLLAAVTEASLNRFSAGRTRDGDEDLLRSFNVGNIFDFGLIETFLAIECVGEDVINVFEDYDCDIDIDFVLGADMRDGFETKHDQEHVPFISRQRMREVNFFGLSVKVKGDGSLTGAFRDLFEGVSEIGHTSAERHGDVGNVANTTLPNVSPVDLFLLPFGLGDSLALETYRYNNLRACSLIPLIKPAGTLPGGGLGEIANVCGLNAYNMWASCEMRPSLLCPFVVADDHWDRAYSGVEPIHSHEIPPDVFTPVDYAFEVAGDDKVQGVPRYDWAVDLDNVGFANYIYPLTGSEIRPNGTKGGNNNNRLTGPSIAVVGVKPQQKINNIQGLGIGNPYSMSALARAQVYYVRNPNRPDEEPSLFNPHWVARLAPIDSNDTPALLKEGLPFISSVGLGMTPTH